MRKPVTTLGQLIDGLPARLVRGSASTLIESIVEDSRQVGSRSMFVARKGQEADGRRFVPQAVEAGCRCLLSDASVVDSSAPDVAVIVPDAGVSIAALAAMISERFHGHPSRRLRLIGITGTNGKTTTAHLLQQLLQSSGRRCGLLGTVLTDTGRSRAPASLTTPSAIDISGLLGEMVDNGCVAAVMEVSSHALHQGRTAALTFAGGVFTNLTGDHLDYHGTEDAYRDAKAMLFAQLGPDAFAVVNVDDPSGAAMAGASRAPVLGTSTTGADASCRCLDVHSSMGGTRAVFEGPWGRLDVTTPLVGPHNLSNALQATAVAHRLGLDGPVLQRGLATCTAPPGRLERVTEPDAPFSVLVDYAHTDDALDNVLAALRPLVPENGRLRVVFGCGGDRDRSKRPRMARAAWRFADEVIITSDNPRTEDPDAIIADAFAGVPAERTAATQCITDRRAAIELAVDRSSAGDVVLVAGKGHEDYQIVGTERRHFDDREVARDAVSRLSAGSLT